MTPSTRFETGTCYCGTVQCHKCIVPAASLLHVALPHLQHVSKVWSPIPDMDDLLVERKSDKKWLLGCILVWKSFWH